AYTCDRCGSAGGTSASPTSTSTVVMAPRARRSSANEPTVDHTTRSSGQDARCTATAGVAGRYAEPTARSSRASSSGRGADRNRAMVAPSAANLATDSRAGTDAAVRSARRVSTTLWANPGTVSSRPTAAAAAATDDTPGTISKVRSCATHHATCSAMAPNTE